jgi:hypothetical protein
MNDHSALIERLESGDQLQRLRGGRYTFLRRGRRDYLIVHCHEHDVQEAWPADQFLPLPSAPNQAKEAGE